MRDPKTDHRLPVLPDGYFSLRYPDGKLQVCLLEIDMGTLTLHRFRRKVRSFEIFEREGLFEKVFGHSTFEVFVLTHSQPRLEQLHRAADQEVSASRKESYALATFDILTKFGDAAWTRLDGSNGTLLYEDSEAEDDGEGDDDGDEGDDNDD